jgi:hypothetical protein
MIARYILCFLWGASLASGWWATAHFGITETGPNKIPLVIALTVLASLGTLGVAGYVLIKAAVDGKP